MKLEDAKSLYLKTARFWLENVKCCDRQTVEDVLALMQWPEEIKTLKWAIPFGRGQVFTAGVVGAGKLLTELNIIQEESARRTAARELREAVPE